MNQIYSHMERKVIAHNIREYAKLHEYETAKSYSAEGGEFVGIKKEPMTAYHRDLLDLIALDVEGSIIHAEL